MTVDVDGDRYEMIQIVTNRYSSQYQNILMISDVLGLVGNFTYTCYISNMAGRESRNIHTSVAGNEILIHSHSRNILYVSHPQLNPWWK